MHRARNMVGELRASHNVSVWKRYLRMSKHRQPGSVMKTIVNLVVAIEVKLGVVVYG